MLPLQDKLCVVTGANAGIGKHTAHALAKMGARVVMVCRSESRGQAALEELSADAPPGSLELMLADLSDLESLARFGEAFRARFDRLDVLVNNAGLYLPKRQETDSGLELMFAINHLGTFAITQQLIEPLKQARGRIVVVASEAHRVGTIDLDDLQATRRFGAFRQYGVTKRANIVFTYELARRLEAHGVTANVLHPGTVATEFAQDEPSFFGKLARWSRPFLISAQSGARTSIHLASDPGVAETTGTYFIRCKPRKSAGQTYDQELQRKLWELSTELCGLDHIPPA